jgi:hypothetical protein
MFEVGCWAFGVSAFSNLHHLFVFRHDDFGFRFHRAQYFASAGTRDFSF